MSEVELQLIHSSYRPHCNHVIHKRHDYHVLCMTTEGGVRLQVEKTAYDLEAGSIWYCYPGPLIGYQAEKLNWSHRHVAFRGPLAEQWFKEGLLGLEPHHYDPIAVRRLSEAFDAFLAACDAQGEWAERYRTNLLENLLILAKDLKQAGGRSVNLVNQITRWFRELEFTNPDVRDWAQRLGMGESTLRRNFARESGRSLHQFCMELRLKEACYLLSHSELNQEQIAESCGYASVHHFSKAFKQAMKLTAGEYRRQL